jgi:TolB-like protein
VEEKLSGRTDEIKEYTIGVKALGRPVDFNPQLDAIVRIHAGRLRRMLTEYYKEKGINDAIIIGIPKGTYIPVFEHRDEGSKKEFVLPSHDAGATTITNSNADESNDHKPVLAIFPFHNLSSNEAMNYFVEGMGEQLSIDFARFQHISVLSYYSTWKYAEEIKDFGKLKQITGADYVLAGSVRFIDDLVRFNVELASAQSGIMIWAETYLRRLTMGNVYDVQDEIVNQILTAIADDYGIISNKNASKVSPAKRTGNQNVFEAMSLYYAYQKEYEPGAYHAAFNALKHALTLEPENSMVLAMVSKMYLDKYALMPLGSKDVLKEGMKHAQRAVENDHNCQQAHQSLAWAYLLSGQKEESYESIERCIALNPKATTVTGNMGFGLICLGYFEQGFELISKSMKLSPRLPWCSKLGLSLYHYHKQKFTESLSWAAKIVNPQVPIISLLRVALHRKLKFLNPELTVSKEDLEILPEIKNYIPEIIGRFILDTDTKEDVLGDLRAAGFAVIQN